MSHSTFCSQNSVDSNSKWLDLLGRERFRYRHNMVRKNNFLKVFLCRKITSSKYHCCLLGIWCRFPSEFSSSTETSQSLSEGRKRKVHWKLLCVRSIPNSSCNCIPENNYLVLPHFHLVKNTAKLLHPTVTGSLENAEVTVLHSANQETEKKKPLPIASN